MFGSFDGIGDDELTSVGLAKISKIFVTEDNFFLRGGVLIDRIYSLSNVILVDEKSTYSINI